MTACARPNGDRCEANGRMTCRYADRPVALDSSLLVIMFVRWANMAHMATGPRTSYAGRLEKSLLHVKLPSCAP